MIKDKTCWIITDGKIGTENQCIGLANNLVESYETKRISLKKIWSILNPYIRIDAINPCTEKFDSYPDILIISGRQAVSVGLHIKHKSPKTIVICIQDSRVARDKFDYLVIPEHDKYRGKNVILTTGSMHKLTVEKIAEDGEKFAPLFKDFTKNKTISVLIGGNSCNHKMDLEITKILINNLKECANKLDANIALTASRRTPKECFELIQQELKNSSDVYIYNGEGDNPYFALMDIADYIFATNDSMSMVSEAIFTGKPVYLMELKGHSEKFERFHNGLRDKGIVKFLGKDEFVDYSYERIENAKKVAEEIEGEIYDKN